MDQSHQYRTPHGRTQLPMSAFEPTHHQSELGGRKNFCNRAGVLSRNFGRQNACFVTNTICIRGIFLQERKRVCHSHVIADPTQESDGVREIRILLIGKTGNGKSATGNTILGAEHFKESVGILSATDRSQFGESRRRKIKVVDTPDIFSDMGEADAKAEVRRWRFLTSPFPTAILHVIRADVRFTAEEYAIYRKTKRLLGRQLHDNLIVVFTMTDKLKTNKLPFEEELGQANEELKLVLHDAGNRYVLFDNTLPRSSEQPQIDVLLRLISRLPNKRPALRLLLLGEAGSGKSATGNSILSRDAFPSHIGMGIVTRECRKETDLLAGHPVEIVDTPGIVNPQIFSTDFPKWCSNVEFSRGFDVILFVMKGDDRFPDDTEYQFFKTVKKVLGDDVRQKIVVVFTHGDRLSKCRTDIHTLLRSAPPSMQKMIQEIDDKYVIFDNITDDAEVKALQRLDLLDMICDIVERDKNRKLKVLKAQNGGQTQEDPPPADVVVEMSSTRRCIIF